MTTMTMMIEKGNVTLSWHEKEIFIFTLDRVLCVSHVTVISYVILFISHVGIETTDPNNQLLLRERTFEEENSTCIM